MRRTLGATIATLAFLSAAGTAQAKVDEFDLTVTHEATASDHAVVVTVTTDGPNQIAPDTINVFLRSDLDDQFRPRDGRSGIQVHLEPVDAQTSKAVVALPAAGEWVVLPFADLEASDFVPLESADRYPIVSFVIPWTGRSTRIHAPSKSSSPWPLIGAIAGGAVLTGLVVLGVFQLLDRRKGQPQDA